MQYKNLKVFIPIFLLLFFFSFFLSPNFTVAEENECPFEITASKTEFEENPQNAGSLSGKLTFRIKDQYKEIIDSYEMTVKTDLEESPNQEQWLKFARDKITIEKDNDVEVPFYIHPKSLQEGEIYTAKIIFTSEPSYDIPPITITLRVLTDPTMEVELRKSTLYLHSVYNSQSISEVDAEKYPYQLQLIVKNMESKCSKLHITFKTSQDWLTIQPEGSSENPISIREGETTKCTVSVNTARIKNLIKIPSDCTLTIISNDPNNGSYPRTFELKPTELELFMTIGNTSLEKKYTPSIGFTNEIDEKFIISPMIQNGTSYVQLKTILECIDGKTVKYQPTDDNTLYRIQLEDKTIILIDNATGEDSYIIIPESTETDMRLGSVNMLNYKSTLMLSTRSVADIFNMDLGWDGDKKQITLRKELVHSSHYVKEKSGENN